MAAIYPRCMSKSPDWRSSTAPSLAEFESLAAEARQSLPSQFSKMCEDVLVRVEDFPTDEVLDALDVESEFDLLGLYQGISIDRKSVMDAPLAPDMVFLYRRPILAIGRSTRRRSAISSPMFLFMRSAIISGSRMPIWRRSRPRRARPGRESPGCANGRDWANHCMAGMSR